MDKNVKGIIFGTVILVVLAIGLTIYACISGNYQVAGDFAIGVIAVLFAFVFIGSAIYYLIGVKKLHDKKKRLYIDKVEKKKTLPLYSKNLIVASILFYIIIALTLSYGLRMSILQDKQDVFNYYLLGCTLLSLIGAIVFYLKLRQAKMLYLIKDEEKIAKYEDNINETSELFNIKSQLGIGGFFVKRKCESIELDNNIRIWSCFLKQISHSVSPESDYYTSYYNYIVASNNYSSAKRFSIKINNRPSVYLNKDNQYISKYSNLPPFLIDGNDAKYYSSRIEEICSDFFSKTRSKYVLMIEGGLIVLGLKSARFGGTNRIFNKNKTIELTKEAIEEIANFMIKIRNVLNNY